MMARRGKTIRLDDGFLVDTSKFRFMYSDVDRHDNVRVYVQRRRGAPKVRLRDWSGIEVFMAEYRVALADAELTALQRPSPAAPGSLRWFAETYYRSAEFRGLGESTRRVRRGLIDGLCAKHGTKPYARLEARHVRELRDEKADHPEAANARVKALRQLYRWGVEVGHCDQNPAREVPYLRPINPEGFHTWTIEEVRRFEERHPIGAKARLALALLLYTGARRSDVVRLGRQMERYGALVFTEAKGQARAVKSRVLPILPELRAVLDATPSGHLAYLVTEFGKPFTPAGFGNWFRRRCNEAGLPHCSAHGLRKAGATIAANNGATEHQLMAIFGWQSPKQAARYTEAANRAKLAADAMHLLAIDQKVNESLPPEPVISTGGRNRAKKS